MGVQWKSPKCSGPKSTISVTDLGRSCTSWKFLIIQWIDVPPKQYIASWVPTCLETWGSATWVLPIKLGICEARGPNRTLSDMDSRDGAYSGGRQRVRGLKSAISLTDLGSRITVGQFPPNQRSDAAPYNIFHPGRERVWQLGGPPSGYFPESWKSEKAWPQIAPFATWILGMGHSGGRQKVRGPKSTI